MLFGVLISSFVFACGGVMIDDEDVEGMWGGGGCVCVFVWGGGGGGGGGGRGWWLGGGLKRKGWVGGVFSSIGYMKC